MNRTWDPCGTRTRELATTVACRAPHHVRKKNSATQRYEQREPDQQPDSEEGYNCEHKTNARIVKREDEKTLKVGFSTLMQVPRTPTPRTLSCLPYALHLTAVPVLRENVSHAANVYRATAESEKHASCTPLLPCLTLLLCRTRRHARVWWTQSIPLCGRRNTPVRDGTRR